MAISRVYLVIFLYVTINMIDSLEFNKYHTHEELEGFLINFTESDTMSLHKHLYSIGKSPKGRDLWVVELTSLNALNKSGVPKIKLIGSIHGNEPVGREILLHFLQYLSDNYNNNKTIKWLLDNTRIHLLPSLNADGFALANEGMCYGDYGRSNGYPRGKDLDRSFPDFYHENNMPEQPETIATEKWLNDIPFILSASFHGGALVASYPFDTAEIVAIDVASPSITPDDDVFHHLASVYSCNHHTMQRGVACNNKKLSFKNGITNGAAWTTFIGSMQDYNYIHGCMEITLGISCCKYPKALNLPMLWEENRLALIEFCKQVHHGIAGQVFDSSNLIAISNVSLRIIGRNITFYSTKESGEFWRILLPGKYQLQVNSPGYHESVVEFTVSDTQEYPELEFLVIFLDNSTMSSTITTTETRKSIETTTAMVQRTATTIKHNKVNTFKFSSSSQDIIKCNFSLLTLLFISFTNI